MSSNPSPSEILDVQDFIDKQKFSAINGSFWRYAF